MQWYIKIKANKKDARLVITKTLGKIKGHKEKTEPMSGSRKWQMESK